MKAGGGGGGGGGLRKHPFGGKSVHIVNNRKGVSKLEILLPVPYWEHFLSIF